MSISKRWPLLGGIIFVIGVVFSGVGTKYLPDELPYFGGSKEVDSADESDYTGRIKSPINLSGEVPYLHKLPVLDGNLFIEQHYSELIFGGVNFKSVKFAARTDEGVEAKFIRVDSSSLVVPIFSMPYLEFEYKDGFYVLEVIGVVTGPNNIDLTYTIRSIKIATMNLQPYSDHASI